MERNLLLFVVFLLLSLLARGQALYGVQSQSLQEVGPKTLPHPIPQEFERHFYILTTELSPAVLVHSPLKEIRFFGNMKKWNLGAPTFCALPLKDTVYILSRGETIEGKGQSESWLLVWFSEASGWENWDVPFLLVLQHRPQKIALSEDGLSLSFPKEAGDIVVMPLYGYFKPPQRSEGVFPSKGIKTWEWRKGLPLEVRKRCNLFSQILRAFPLHVRETFALNGDELLIREEFSWRYIKDDWGTRPKRFAPLPPALALAWWAGFHKIASKPFPMDISHSITDPDLFTPYGPWLGVEDVDAYEIRFPLLQYVHYMEVPEVPQGKVHPSVKEALSWVERRVGEKFPNDDWQNIWDHGGPQNYCWQVMGDRWYAKVIPYLPLPLQERLKKVLKGYMEEFVLKEDNYKPFRGMLLLVGPGIGTWGGYDDAGKFSSNLLETLWCYAHFTGNWALIKEHWDTIKKFFITPLECDWKSFGRYAIAEMGDEASPPLSMARMAYRVGDYETYAFSCYIFVRELVHHYIKQVGSAYFRLNQPWHSLEVMPEEVYLTNLWGDVAGWQIDGPTYPEVTGERQFENRWVRFSNEDVARFYREVLLPEVKKEMDLLVERAKRGETPYRLNEDTAHIAPSLIRLRSLLLNESPEKLSSLSPPEKWSLGRTADGIAFCLSFLRTSHPLRFQRLIPRQNPTKFILGLERVKEMTEYPGLDLALEVPDKGSPFLRWWGWRAPKSAEGLPGGEWWSFGEIIIPGYELRDPHSERLNWNTLLYRWEVPSSFPPHEE